MAEEQNRTFDYFLPCLQDFLSICHIALSDYEEQSMDRQICSKNSRKVNRKVQEEPQAEAAANPDTRRKRKSDTD